MSMHIETSVDLQSYAQGAPKAPPSHTIHSSNSSSKPSVTPSAAGSDPAASSEVPGRCSCRPGMQQSGGGHQRNCSSPPALSTGWLDSLPQQQLHAASPQQLSTVATPATEHQHGVSSANGAAAGTVTPKGSHVLVGSGSGTCEDAQDETDTAMHAAVASTLRVEQGYIATPQVCSRSSSNGCLWCA